MTPVHDRLDLGRVMSVRTTTTTTSPPHGSVNDAGARLPRDCGAPPGAVTKRPQKEHPLWTGATALPASTRTPSCSSRSGTPARRSLQIEEAKAVCRRCEVVDTCLKWAIESGQDAGVWGGLSEDERRALKRRNARARRAG